MLVTLLKAHEIRKVIISPGATHISLIGSLQHDDFFELYSAVDERGACYMACGLAIESGQPVAVTCTGATASRNYFPGLSEAYHKKLPILAITGSQDMACNGNLIPQFLDRTRQPLDTVRLSVHLQEIKDSIDEWDCNLKINRALLELRHHGGGPVHINLTCTNKYGLMEKSLPPARVINRYTYGQLLPELPKQKRIAISVGAHRDWSVELTEAVDAFCAKYDAVVLADHSSGYHGKYYVLPTISTSQEFYKNPVFDIDLLIHMGEQSGDYYTFYRLADVKEVWRVSEDGELRDTFRKLKKVFEMSELSFFTHYGENAKEKNDAYYKLVKAEIDRLYGQIPDLPFSNIWMAQQMASNIPANSVVHLGVSNTMRAWTFFEFPKSVSSAANIGCRGIDGALSTTLGMSLANTEKIHFCILGDLTFFYNLNALGNRQVGNNIRILLVNNGAGAEFHLYQHTGHKQLGDDVDEYVAAGGHNGSQSRNLIRHFAEDLGFEYITASSKTEVIDKMKTFLKPEIGNKPILFEVFTDCEDESDALMLIRHMQKNSVEVIKKESKEKLKSVLGNSGVKLAKKILKR